MHTEERHPFVIRASKHNARHSENPEGPYSFQENTISPERITNVFILISAVFCQTFRQQKTQRAGRYYLKHIQNKCRLLMVCIYYNGVIYSNTYCCAHNNVIFKTRRWEKFSEKTLIKRSIVNRANHFLRDIRSRDQFLNKFRDKNSRQPRQSVKDCYTNYIKSKFMYYVLLIITYE